MVVIFTLIAILLLLYFVAYRPLKVKAKFALVMITVTFEIIITLVVLGFSIAFVVTRIKEEDKGKLNDRVHSIEFLAESDNYENLPDMLEYKSCFEKEFEVYWERALMYEYALQYAVFNKAGETVSTNGDDTADGKVNGNKYAGLIEKYRTLMSEQCNNPTYSDNVPYGKHFLELAQKWINR